MAIETFDDFRSSEGLVQAGEIKPFQFREDKGIDEETLNWFNEYDDACTKNAQTRLETYRRYISLYKGIHWRANDPRDINRYNDDGNTSRRSPKQTVNFVYEMTEAKVSQRSRNKVAISVLPNNDEISDINNSKLCKMLLDARMTDIDFDGAMQMMDRVMFTFGHSFAYVHWNPYTGPEFPAYTQAKKAYGDKLPKEIVKLIEDRGFDVKNGSVTVGDVDISILGPERVRPELGKNKWEDVDYADILEWVHIDQLKAEYPEFKDKIQETGEFKSIYSFDLEDTSVYKNMVCKHTFYHRPTRFYPEGCKIIWTKDVILSKEDFPYKHKQLPLVPDRDIIVYNEIWGRSFLTNIEQLQRMYNNIQSSIARNEGILAHPKWMVPKGAVKFSNLGNDISIVEFTGPTAPQLIANNGTHQRSLEIQDRTEKKITQMSTVYDISRGEVPSGVTANSALRFLDEQETQRDQTGVARRRTRILNVCKQMLSLMSQYYKAEDGRTIRIVGKDNEYLIRNMKDADFTRTYDVRLQNSSALPDTKTGKISTIIDLNTASQTDPIFTKEEIIQMLDLGMDEPFKNEATTAVTAAKTIVEKLMRGEQVQEPQVSDNFTVYYSIFNKTLQSLTYRDKSTADVKKNFQKYIMTLEMLMFERARKNAKFLQELLQFDMYPMFFTTPMTLTQLMSLQMQATQAPSAPELTTAASQSLQTQQIKAAPQMENTDDNLS